MRVLRTTLAGLVSGALIFSGAALTADSASAAAPQAVVAAKPKPRPFVVAQGVTINNPLGNRASRRVNLDKIRRAIRSSPRGSRIAIASWNIRSDDTVRDLIAAHRRGVGVRVIIDRGNANPKLPNPSFDRMARAFTGMGNAKRTPAMRSVARKCAGACRGSRGIAHTKMYLFSKVGSRHSIVMYGSANLTELSAGYQWNDLYTVVNRPKVYNFSLAVFNQMLAGRTVRNAYVRRNFGNLDLGFFPYKGSNATGDPVLKVLDRVSCKGVAAGHGTNGRTNIRIAQTAINGARGIVLSRKLHNLWDAGCNIKVIYAVMGKQVLREFRRGGPRGGIPFRQVAQDFNNDWVYERYLHTKVLALSGNWNGNPRAEISWNGSANWTQVALDSDDTDARLLGARVRSRYSAFVNRWFANPPRSRLYSLAATGRIAPPPGLDPNRLIQIY